MYVNMFLVYNQRATLGKFSDKVVLSQSNGDIIKQQNKNNLMSFWYASCLKKFIVF